MELILIKILFLSFYYPPDLSAGSFRASSLISEFLADFKGKVEIELITTEPNRYSGYDPEPQNYHNNSLIIHRIRLPKHKGGFADQARSFLFYAIAALNIVKNEKYDLIFATSGRLMTASLGAFISKKNRAPLYLDIRDIFVDTLSSIFINKSSRVLIPLFNFIESLTINQACHVNLVSNGFKAYFYKKYPDQSFSFFSNGIDEEFLNLKTSLSYHNPVKKRGYKIIIMYAGNIGDGQGLHKIIPKLALELGDRFHFKVIGGGSRVRELEEVLRLLEIKNVELIPPISRDKLMIEYLLSDILFLHLNNLPAFEKVLPSKLFEYAALEKPILAGVSGYAKSFIESEIVNSQVFSPCDIKGAMVGLEKLNLCSTPRPIFIEKYSRKSLSRSFAEDIMSKCI